MVLRIILCLYIMTTILMVSILGILVFSKATNKPIFIQKEFIPLFHEFQQTAKYYKIPVSYYKLITVFTENLPDGVAGVCHSSTNTIVISKKSWRFFTDSEKKILLFHEWGHCLLNREHTEARIVTHCPQSIMYPVIDPTAACYVPTLRSYYEYELFVNPYKHKTFSRRK